MSRMRAGLGLAALLVMLLVPLSQVQAGGFSIYEQGARAMGRASAFVAMPSDPSAIFYNPAGLTLLDGTQIYVGGTFIMPTGEFDGAGLYTGAAGTMKGQIFTPPNLYVSHRLNEKMVVGLGVHTPFGLGTAWEDQAAWAGRYVSVDSEIQMFGINPTVAYQVNDQLSVGVGVDYRMSSVNVKQYVPGAMLNPAFTGYDVATVALESDMNSAIGFNVGLLYALNEKINLGLAYRSPVTLEYTGTAEFTQVLTGVGAIDAAVAAGLPAAPVDVETAIDYPGVFTAGLAYKLNDNLLVEGDIQYWFWSVFKELSISGLPTGDVTMDENYEDAFELRVGLEYWKSETMALRAGFVHDQTPVPKESISPMLPDASRNGITGGVGLTFGSMTVDAAFMYLMFADAETATVMATGYPIGTYKNSALLFGVNLGFAIGK